MMQYPRHLIRLLALSLPLSLTLAMPAKAAETNADKDADKKAQTTPAPGKNETSEKVKKEAAESNEHSDEVKLTDDVIRQYGVRVGIARKRKLESNLVVPARVQFNADAMAVVGSAVVGRVTEVKVHVGDAVKKGDTLLVIESPELGEAQSDLLQKQAALAAAEVGVEPARGAYERGKKLYDESQGMSLTDLQKRELELKVAQTGLLTAKAALDAADNRLSLLGMSAEAIKQLKTSAKINPSYSIRSPLDGQVIERPVTFGELVKPEREKLVVVANMDVLWVVAEVPDSRLREIPPKAKATIAIASAGDQTFTGTVTNIAPSVNAETRSIPVRIEVKGDPALKPGMFAQVDIAGRTENGDEAVLAVPDAAIQTVDGSTAVFVAVKGEENTFAMRHVSIGTPAGGMIPIISGLNEGERIATAGTFLLKADLGKAGAKDSD